ncbi:MAG TPA: hypothetical protein PLU25_09325, partial [Acidobacteriota bacterium]|nr:hypothetical protein [Acidobacteriota bacterium]
MANARARFERALSLGNAAAAPSGAPVLVVLEEVRIEQARLPALVGLNLFPVARHQIPDGGRHVLDPAAAPLAAHVHQLLNHSLHVATLPPAAALATHRTQVLLDGLAAAASLAAHPAQF